MVKVKSKTNPAPTGEFLTPSIVSMDGGNGKFLMFRMKDGVLQSKQLPNARVRVTGYDLGKDVLTLGTSKLYYADFLGERYGVGDDVWSQTANQPETFANTSMRYGSDYHIFMALVTLAAGDVETDEPIHLIISAPPGDVKDVSKRMKKAFKAGENQDDSGEWTIKLSTEKKPRTYTIGKVTVIPEGVGTFAAYGYDINGEPVTVPHPKTGHDLLAGTVLVADGGMGTFDTFIIRDGNLSLESIQGATDGGFGISSLIITPIREQVVQMLKAKGVQPPPLPDPMIDSWLKRWVSASSKLRNDVTTVLLSGQQLVLNQLFTQVVNRAAELVIAQKLEPQLRQGVDTVMATGGEWLYIGPRVLEAYGSKRMILFPDNVPHLANIGVLELNAFGGLVMAAIMARAKAAQP